MKRLLALLCCAATSVPAMAADWQVFIEDEKFTLYYNPSGVRKEKNAARVWVLFDYVELQVRILGAYNHKAYSSMLEFVEFDCADERRNSLQASYRSGPMGSGDLIDTVTHTAKNWSYVAPGTVGAALLDQVCGKK